MPSVKIRYLKLELGDAQGKGVHTDILHLQPLLCRTPCLTNIQALADCKSRKSMTADVRTSFSPRFLLDAQNKDETLDNPNTTSVLAPDPTNTAEAHLTSAESHSHRCSALTPSMRKAPVHIAAESSGQCHNAPLLAYIQGAPVGGTAERTISTPVLTFPQ